MPPQTDLTSLLPFAIAFAAGATGDVAEIAALKTKLRTWAKDDPMDAVLATVLGGGLAYYLAERESNGSLATPWDGVLQMAGAIWHGTQVAPTTAAGRALVAFVQAVGPTLALSFFDDTAAEKRAAAAQEAAMQAAMLERLDKIVQLLERAEAQR